MKIAIDLDGTISEYPDFFKLFTKTMQKAGCRIYIVTDRPQGSEEQVAEELKNYGITYDFIEITSDKARYILKKNINVLYDDTDEYFLGLPEKIAVFKIRQKYNFDFKLKKWLYNKKTGRST